MNESQLQRTLRTIERSRAEKEREIQRLDDAAAALRALLPETSSNGAGPTPPTRSSTSGATRVRGAKNYIEQLLKGSPRTRFSIAELRQELDQRRLLNPRAQDPEKQIGTALRRLRTDDARFERVGRGEWAFIPEEGGTGLGPTSESKSATPEKALR